MNWRTKMGMVLGATCALTVVVALAMRILALVPPGAGFKAEVLGNTASAPTPAHRVKTISLAKTPPHPLAEFPSFEIISPGDEGALWDDGPAYDLSR